MANVKPCPFCGSKLVELVAKESDERWQIAVRCMTIVCGGLVYGTNKKVVVQAWNRRAEKTGYDVIPGTETMYPLVESQEDLETAKAADRAVRGE